MKPAWLKLAGELLDLASTAFTRHGCNDWKWPEDWSHAARVRFARAMVADNTKRTPRQFTAEDKEKVESMAEGEYGPPDWWVMAFLASQLQEGK
jgi:trimethylamine:corrinoid methyltransferase-like protein